MPTSRPCCCNMQHYFQSFLCLIVSSSIVKFRMRSSLSSWISVARHASSLVVRHGQRPSRAIQIAILQISSTDGFSRHVPATPQRNLANTYRPCSRPQQLWMLMISRLSQKLLQQRVTTLLQPTVMMRRFLRTRFYPSRIASSTHICPQSN